MIEVPAVDPQTHIPLTQHRHYDRKLPSQYVPVFEEEAEETDGGDKRRKKKRKKRKSKKKRDDQEMDEDDNSPEYKALKLQVERHLMSTYMGLVKWESTAEKFKEAVCYRLILRLQNIYFTQNQSKLTSF